MATSKPNTYESKTVIKECFNALAYCSRVALRELPTEFFLYFTLNIIKRIKADTDYKTALGCSPDGSLNKTEAIRITMEVFKETAEELEVYHDRIHKVYEDYLNNRTWVLYDLRRMAHWF